MKHRIIGIILTVALVFSNVNPSFASGIVISSEIEKVSESSEGSEVIEMSEIADTDGYEQIEDTDGYEQIEDADGYEQIEDADGYATIVNSEEVRAEKGKAILLQEGAIEIPQLPNIELVNEELTGGNITAGMSVSVEEQLCTLLYNGLNNEESEIDISSLGLLYPDDWSALSDVFSYVINNNPDLFFVKGGYSSSIDYRNNILSVKPNYLSADRDIYTTKLNEAYSIALSNIDSDDPTYTPSVLDKYLAFHDYLVNNCLYNKEVGAGGTATTRDVYSAYGVFVNRDAVCQGYAMAYMALCKKAGIDCYYVCSDSMNHAWNMVKIGGDYYHIDATWDDPTWNRVGLVDHNYFLVSDTQMVSSRKHSNWSAEHTAGNSKYDNAYWYTEKVSSPIIKIDGNYYYINYSGSPHLIKRAADGTENVMDTLAVWKASSSGSYWTGAFSGLFLYNGMLLYNTGANIYAIYPDGTGKQVSYAFNQSGKNCYGISLENGELHYAIREYEKCGISPASTAYEVSLPKILSIGTLSIGTPYTITLNPSGGNLAGSNTITAYYGAKVGTLPVPTKTGYEFAGWATVPNGDAHASENMVNANTIYNTHADKTYYAQWTAASYNITLNVNGATKDSDRTIVSSSFDNISSNFTYGVGYNLKNLSGYGLYPPVGKVFEGWNTKADGSGIDYAATTGAFSDCTSGVVLYAKWGNCTHSSFNLAAAKSANKYQQISAPTCTSNKIVNFYCDDCKGIVHENYELLGTMVAHVYSDTPIITKATFAADGKVESKCINCENRRLDRVIKKVDTIEVLGTYKYTGSAIIPTFRLLDEDSNEIVTNVGYEVTNNVIPGTAKLSLLFAPQETYYAGSDETDFTILKADKPFNTPTAISSTIATGKKVCDTTGLPNGWEWGESEKNDVLPTVVGATKNATAIYTKTPDKNYFTTLTSNVVITMTDCNHANGTYTTEENRVEPTCTADGSYDEVRHCSQCDAIVSSQEKVINKLGHNFVTYYPNDDATCTQDGTKTATCARGGCLATDNKPDTGSKLPHSFEDYISDGNGTCFEDGTKTSVCSTCHVATNTITDIDSKVAHVYDEVYTVDSYPTCVCKGLKSRHCIWYEKCHQKTDETDIDIDPNTHAWDGGSILINPTYESMGTTHYTCELCGETKDEINIPKLDYLSEASQISETEYEVNLAVNEKYCITELSKEKGEKLYKITYNKVGNVSDSKYASLSNKGLIVGKKAGVANIKLERADKITVIKVNVYNPAFVYSNPKMKYFVANAGDKITPTFENYGLKVRYELDKNAVNKGIAKVNENTGEVTVLKNGNITVTAIIGGTQNTKYAKKIKTKIKAFDPTFVDVKVGKSGTINEIPVGKSIGLKIKYGNGKTEWNSSDNSVATVDARGKLKAVSAGTVVIKAINNGRKMSKTITVIQ